MLNLQIKWVREVVASHVLTEDLKARGTELGLYQTEYSFDEETCKINFKGSGSDIPSEEVNRVLCLELMQALEEHE